MACLWVLAAVLLWTEAGLAAHLHKGETNSAAGRRRTLHTTEGHSGQVQAPELPVALPRVGAPHEAVAPLPLPKGPLPSRRKREPRSSVGAGKVAGARASSAAVLGQLGKILKDDETEIKKRVPPDVKRQVDLKANETIDEGNERKQQTFEDWLRDEYIRNMALSIATVKKKRSSFDSRRKRSSRRDDTAGAAQEAKLRLQSLENAVLADALSEIVIRRDDASEQQDEEEGDLVARRLAQAYYLEKLRGAVQKIEEEAAHRETWGTFQDDRDETEDEVDDLDDDYSYQKRDDNSLSSVLPIVTQLDSRTIMDEEACPALHMLTSDCASLEELLTEGEMSLALRHACNKHEVCYTCGEVFGLSSNSCDKVFLEDVSNACRSCSERALGQLLVPLRDQRVFYKRSVPPLCYRAPCVQRYLEEHY